MPKLTKKKYLPKEFKGLFFGMSLDEFKNLKNTSNLKIKTSAYVSYATEPVNTSEIESYIFQFDRHKLLYEIIIQFTPQLDAQQYITEHFGQANQDNEILVQVSDFLFLKIWTYHNRICIANAAYFKEELAEHQAALI